MKENGGNKIFIVMDFYNAEKQFNENFRMFANVTDKAEKYNFYAGLGNMAKGLQQLEMQVTQIQNNLVVINENIRKLANR